MRAELDSYFEKQRIPMFQSGSISSINQDGTRSVRLRGRGQVLSRVDSLIPSFSPSVGEPVTVVIINGDYNNAYIAGMGYRSGF